MAQRSKPKKIAVIGNGSWGTALALVLNRNGHDVRLWGAFSDHVARIKRKRENELLPGIKLPRTLLVTDDAEAALDGVDAWINAVPTKYIRSVMTNLEELLHRRIPVVSVAKGVENESLLRASQVITDVLGPRKLAVLVGPSHAEEVGRKLATTVVVASRNPAFAKQVQTMFQCETFRVYTNSDIAGVEMGGALKNVIAIAAGMCDGLGLGDNTKAALLTRGLAEITRLGVKMGGRKTTFAGLSGMGDLIVTCISPYGRNRRVGELIGKGKTLKQILSDMKMVAEGVWTTKSAVALARKHRVEMPITDEVYKILFRNKKADRALRDLMRRAMKSEVER